MFSFVLVLTWLVIFSTLENGFANSKLRGLPDVPGKNESESLPQNAAEFQATASFSSFVGNQEEGSTTSHATHKLSSGSVTSSQFSDADFSQMLPKTQSQSAVKESKEIYHNKQDNERFLQVDSIRDIAISFIACVLFAMGIPFAMAITIATLLYNAASAALNEKFEEFLKSLIVVTDLVADIAANLWELVKDLILEVIGSISNILDFIGDLFDVVNFLELAKTAGAIILVFAASANPAGAATIILAIVLILADHLEALIERIVQLCVPSATPSATPSASPTVSISPTVAPISSPTCEDDAAFQFILDTGNPVGTCLWLTQNSNPDNNAFRIAKYCNRPVIKMACKVTCSFCTCEDNDDFEFMLDIDDVGENSGSCAWLTKNTANVQIRRLKYCFVPDDDGVEIISGVGNKCPPACGLCQ